MLNLGFQNIEMDDVVLLKEDMLSYYRQYRESQLEIMELEEEISKLRADASHQSLGQSPLEEVRIASIILAPY